MKIACLYFTESGQVIAESIKQKLSHEVDIFHKEVLRLEDAFKNIFENYHGIVFMSAAGIAVRLIAPYIKDKTKDPGVVVVDDLGRYSISLLSGHIGGANALAADIADAIGAQAVITTASDGRGIESVDMFAIRHKLYIESMEEAKLLTAMMIDGKRIKLISEIDAEINYHNIVDDNEEGYIIVTSKEVVDYKKPYCLLRPRNLNVGIGCRRGKDSEEIITAIKKVFKENNLSLKSINMVGTVDVKKDEQGIIDACRNLGCDLKIFTREEIETVQNKFKGSCFVEDTIGVKSVAEPCAYLLSSSIIVSKTAIDGVTVSVGYGHRHKANETSGNPYAIMGHKHCGEA